MFWWILNALISSISEITWKKSLTLSDVSSKVFYLLGSSGSVVISITLLSFGFFAFPENPWFLLIPAADALVVSYNGMLSQKIYKEEKLSALMPYQNLASVLTIVAAFFIFRNTSFLTLGIAISIIVLIFARSFDFKNMTFPKKLLPVLLYNGINSLRQLVMGYVLLHMTAPTFYSLRNLLNVVIFSIGFYMAGEILNYREWKREFLTYRIFTSFIWGIAALIGFTLIQSLGIVTTILLGFLSMSVTLILQWLFLKEIPERKDVFFSFLVAALVGIGVYFR